MLTQLLLQEACSHEETFPNIQSNITPKKTWDHFLFPYHLGKRNQYSPCYHYYFQVIADSCTVSLPLAFLSPSQVVPLLSTILHNNCALDTSTVLVPFSGCIWVLQYLSCSEWAKIEHWIQGVASPVPYTHLSHEQPASPGECCRNQCERFY